MWTKTFNSNKPTEKFVYLWWQEVENCIIYIYTTQVDGIEN